VENLIIDIRYPLGCRVLRTKVEAPITDRGPIADFNLKKHTFLKHISMKAIDNCLKLKLSGIGSSTLVTICG
jgi:hypothetical protein